MKILYEDKHILVCFKESGLAVQSARFGQKDLVSLLKNHLALSTGKNDPYLGIIHRLDQPVSGILVFAKTPAAAADLSRQAAGKTTMQKIYHARIHLPSPSGTQTAANTSRNGEQWLSLTDYLLKDGRTNTSRVVSPQTPGAKKSELLYKFLSVDSETQTAETEIQLLTGRHHQIRVQFAHAGMPLVGDRKYGNPGDTTPLALCAVSLTFTHPATGKEVRFALDPVSALHTQK